MTREEGRLLCIRRSLRSYLIDCSCFAEHLPFSFFCIRRSEEREMKATFFATNWEANVVILELDVTGGSYGATQL